MPAESTHDPRNDGDHDVAALCCAACEAPVASVADVRGARVPRRESDSYPYQLDVLCDPDDPAGDDGGRDCWVYSATNPHGVRFDVVRLGGGAVRRAHVYGAPTAEHTFFPPHPWRMASCARCGTHLGWLFGQAAGPAAGADVEEGPFLGLILTHLRERRVPASDLDAMLELATARATTSLATQAMHRLRGVLESGGVAEALEGLEGVEEAMDAMERELATIRPAGSGEAEEAEEDANDDES